MQHRILVSGFDKGTVSEVTRVLSTDINALVPNDHEFSKALETGNKYKWLSNLIDMEEIYHQSIVILWFGDNDKRKGRPQNPNNKRILDYSNELLFSPWSNRKLQIVRTRIYFVNISDKARMGDVAEIIQNRLGDNDVLTFTATGGIVWSYEDQIMELIRND